MGLRIGVDDRLAARTPPAPRGRRADPPTAGWFWWGVGLRVVAVLALGHVYDESVFRDAATRLASGHGVYAVWPLWFAGHGEGYFAYPPVYAYMLAAAGRVAAWLGGHWLVLLTAIKVTLLAGDVCTYAVLRRLDARTARRYWTLWFVPVYGIGMVQPDIWAGVAALLAYLAARRDRWALSGALLGAGAAVKFLPAVIVPFGVAYLLRRGTRADAATFALYAVAGFVIAWLPYLALYRDAWEFPQVAQYQLVRTGGEGLTVLGTLGAAGSLAQRLGAPYQSVERFRDLLDVISGRYAIVTAGFMLALVVSAAARGWTLERTFVIPLVGFLASSRFVHAQFLFEALPVALVAEPAFLGAIAWPLTMFLLAGSTPLVLIPRGFGDVNIGGPYSSTVAAVVLLALTAGSALVFSLRLWRMSIEAMRSTS